MKLRLITLSLTVIFFSVSIPGLSQCPYLGSQFGTSAAPNEAGVETVMATCIFAGEFIRITGMQEGMEYRVETCGDPDFDTEITLFAAGGGADLGYNDDACGVQSILNYTPAADGSYDYQVNESPGCQTNNTCMTMKLMLLTNCYLECPADITVQTSNPLGTTVNYTVSELPSTNTCAPQADDSDEESGDNFPIGTTLVEITDQTGSTVTCSFNITVDLVLPVEYLYFKGTPFRTGNLLEWATASEENNAYFTIQRSLDAWAWEDIKRIEGQANSSIEKQYQFLDEDLPVTKDVYYRLMQTDNNGEYSYTDIIQLPGAVPNPRVDVFPNPADTEFTLSLQGVAPDQEAQISLINIENKTILSRQVTGNGEYKFDIPETIAPGVYLLQVTSANGIKKVKQIIIY